jgi:benzil reductase ((S)-benzoin forming)
MSKSLYIITGCSRGIGKALLDAALQQEDAHVVGLSRSTMESNSRFTHIETDLSDWQSLAEKEEQIFPDSNDFSRIALVNNAAWLGEVKYFGEMEPASLTRLCQINVVAPMVLINAFVKKYGSVQVPKVVANISSGAGQRPIDGLSGYCSTKAALDMFTQIGAQEARLRNMDIHYFTMIPGIVDTEMQGDIRGASEDSFSSLQQFKGYKESKALSAPSAVAQNILRLLNSPELAKDVFVNVSAS